MLADCYYEPGAGRMEDVATVIAATIAAIASVLTLALSSRMTIDRERRQMQWSRELDRLVELERIAGRLADVVLSYRTVQTLEREFSPAL